MADYFDISEWNEKPWYQTGGTRNKVIIENPSNHAAYFFKTSLKREMKDYKYEFWSEIIASEVGISLGFDMLKYDIAFNRGEIGCLSKSMVTEGENKLTEGIGYLTGYDTSYNPEERDSKSKYTFQIICESLKHFNLEHYINNIIELIVLDSIIGNGDRHQENWGIITIYNEVIKSIEEFAKKEKINFFNKIAFKIIGSKSSDRQDKRMKVVKKIQLKMDSKFSQIYDSGSCLGRELSDEKINQMLTDTSMLKAYINRGVAEIHWEGKKLNHFKLIQEINKFHSTRVKEIIERVRLNYIRENIESIVQNIDLNLPEDKEQFKLPPKRKNFIIKLITLRIENLFKII